MAHFTRVRAFGLWTDGGALLASEMELFDAHQSKAINGAEGGAWAPPDPIEIGGAGGLKVTGPCVVTSNAQLQGGATITGGDLTVAQDAVVQGTLDVEDLATLDSLAVVNGATVQGPVVLQDALAVTGNIGTDGDVFCERVAIHGSHLGSNILSVNGAARITGNTEINGQFACDGAAAFGSTLGIGGPVTPTGAGRVRRKVAAGADANTTYTAASAQQIIVLSITADRIYTLSTTDAADGDFIRFSSRDGGQTASVVAQGANPVTYPLKLNGTGLFDWIELTYLSGGWYLTGYKDNPLRIGAANQSERCVLRRLAFRARSRHSLTADVRGGLSGDGVLSSAPRLLQLVVHAPRPRRCAGSSGPTARAPGRHVAGRARPVPAAIGVAGLGALAAPGARALDLLPRGADLRRGRVGVVG